MERTLALMPLAHRLIDMAWQTDRHRTQLGVTYAVMKLPETKRRDLENFFLEQARAALKAGDYSTAADFQQFARYAVGSRHWLNLEEVGNE